MALPAADVQVLALAGLGVAGATLAFGGNRTALHMALGSVAWIAPLLRAPASALLGALLLLGAALLAWGLRARAYDEALAGQRDAGPVVFTLAFAVVAALWTALPARLDAGHVLLALLPMAYADPAGFYAGRALGRHRLPSGKSVEGLAAVLLAALLVALPVAWAFTPGPGWWLRGALAAAGSALGEALAPPHLDNLLMPLGALAGLALAAAVLP